MTKKRVYGKMFEEPKMEAEYDRAFYLSIIISIIPLWGIFGILASLMTVLTSSTNNCYGVDEVAWKAVVFGSIIQTLSLTVFLTTVFVL